MTDWPTTKRVGPLILGSVLQPLAGRPLLAHVIDTADRLTLDHHVHRPDRGPAFAAVGKYNEFDQLRVAGVRAADLKGYQYSRDDVDAYAVESQKRAKAAWDDGRFAKSVITVRDQNGIPILVENRVVNVGMGIYQQMCHRGALGRDDHGSRRGRATR